MAQITDMGEGSTIQFLHGITLTIDKIEGNRVSVSLVWRGHSLSYTVTSSTRAEETSNVKPVEKAVPLPKYIIDAFKV